MTEPTITVEGTFGKPKQITRDSFVRTWQNHASDLFAVMPYERVVELASEVATAAGKRWDEEYANQTKSS